MDEIRRGERGKQKTWQWLMVLTAHRGLCVYCGCSAATMIDHEKPIADTGADVWWNFVPACEDCNRWKKGRTARRWVVDMDLHHRYPEAGFATRGMCAPASQDVWSVCSERWPTWTGASGSSCTTAVTSTGKGPSCSRSSIAARLPPLSLADAETEDFADRLFAPDLLRLLKDWGTGSQPVQKMSSLPALGPFREMLHERHLNRGR
ncbi:HNH endonuclease [Streptomyces sp. NBC_00076]|uniref:HNH endonuclease n=1 Tax=Streptomyces sp. NBC_00076 TaxID=2975642 RepID=UPI00386BB73E